MRYRKQKEILFIIILTIIVLFITGYELRLLQSELLIKKMITEEIDYDSFRKFELKDNTLEMAAIRADHVLQKDTKLQSIPYINGIGYLTFSMMANSFDLADTNLVDEKTFCRGICRLALNDSFIELYHYNNAILTDLSYFPVPQVVNSSADVSYVDTWRQPRTYGGDRKHEGTDLMATNNIRGFFPVISITDGIIEKIGWLEQGGYRIGVRSASGGYFYYAHLDSYAPELEQGDTVIAGQFLGFMGDSGYGSEGTVGQFDVHLHLGIYVNTNQGEMSVNPYWILKILEKKRTVFG